MNVPLTVIEPQQPTTGRKPSWLKMKMPAGEGYGRLLKLVTDQRLNYDESSQKPSMISSLSEP